MAYFVGVDVMAADMPHANRLTVGITAIVADEERRMISQRAEDLADVIRDLARTGVTSLSGVTRALTERRTPRGGREWTATQVARVTARLTV